MIVTGEETLRETSDIVHKVIADYKGFKLVTPLGKGGWLSFLLICAAMLKTTRGFLVEESGVMKAIWWDEIGILVE